MKKNITLAALTAFICFAIGILTYFGTTLFVDFLKCELGSCEDTVKTLTPTTAKLPSP